MTTVPEPRTATRSAQISADREIGELRSDMRHVLERLGELKESNIAASNALNNRLDSVEARLDTLFANRAVALGALAVAGSVGAFIMWIFKTIAAPFLGSGVP